MSMKMRYGNDYTDTGFNEDFFDAVLTARDVSDIGDPEECFLRKITGLEGNDSLMMRLKAKQPKAVSIIVEDKTRKNPEYPKFLKHTVAMIKQETIAHVFVVVAYGTHSKHCLEEHISLYGQDTINGVTLVDHDCHCEESLSFLGTLPSGNDLKINGVVAKSDFIITFGTVEPHAFAGFTGGRKAILPGVSAYETIRFNHSMVCLENVALGQLDKNPVHEDMQAAAGLVKVDYTIQLVRNPRGNLCGLFAGELDEAFHSAVTLCRSIASVGISREADLVFVSCGGRPKDASLYHSQRAITAGVMACRKGGLVVVFAQLTEGVGNNQFHQCLKLPLSNMLSMKREEIDIGVHSAWLTAKNLSKCKILLYSQMSPDIASGIGLLSVSDKDTLKGIIKDRFPQKPLSYAIPNGSEVIVELGTR